MGCPKCIEGVVSMFTPFEAVDPGNRFRCRHCGWESPKIGTLVESSPEYRLAKLQAQGAKPGWYGPDGELCASNAHSVVWRQLRAFTPDEARLCGFVEVK